MNSINKTNRQLIVFGKQTAEEIVSAANLSEDSRFDKILSVEFHDQIYDDDAFLSLLQSGISTHYIIGIADRTLKLKACQFAASTQMIPHSVVHPTAFIDPSATIGAGVFIGPQAVVSLHANIGNHSIIHIHSSIGHHACIGQKNAILPGARISGNVKTGSQVMIGSNAFVFQGVSIGELATVDALTYVRHDVPVKKVVSCRSPY